MDIVKDISREINSPKEVPYFKAGDVITVHYRIVEGAKSRVQPFRGVVLYRRGSGATETVAVRKISNSVGVERIFPIFSPNVERIEVNRRGKVRRARLFYLRDRMGKQARIRESRKTDTQE
jgi:large subunit ribosomal protein L19